jgi:ferredoxin-NADP reductase
MMAICKFKLKGRQEIASGTMAFHFEKPQGFSYKAGQFADTTLVNPPEADLKGDTRGLSLASAPYEGDLMVATLTTRPADSVSGSSGNSWIKLFGEGGHR